MGPKTAQTFTLADALREHASTTPAEVGIACESRRYTWAETDKRVDSLAVGLRQAGVAPGDRILWWGQNCHRLIELLCAASRLGAIVCPVNWRQSGRELTQLLEDSAPRVVIWQSREIGAVLDDLVANEQSDITWIQHDGSGPGSYEHCIESSSPEVVEWEHEQDSRALLMMYTAAFAGKPSGALLSGRALIAQSMTIRLLENLDATAVYLNSGPMFHIGSLRRTIAVLHAGGRNIMCRRVDAETLCALIDAERCTAAFLQKPTMVQMIEVNRTQRFDLSSLNSSGGPDGWSDMVTITRDVVRSGYGQTEVAGVVTFTVPGRPGIGAWPGPLASVQIRSADGGRVERGGIGEIVVRGPMVMDGYFRPNGPDVGRIRDGWYHTNDLGRLESDGSISFVGPAERIIKTAAENVYPIEVENVLRAHPDVTDVGVLGVADPEWGQRVKAVVVVSTENSVDGDALLAYARTALAGYKCPRVYEFVDALPRAAGQLDRDALDATHGGGGYPGES